MRILVLICLCLLLTNCEDKQSRQKKNNSSTIDSTKTEKEIVKKDSVTTNTNEIPLLDDKNAIPFFQQYEKENKENKVRIYTDFGNIDILLFEETKYHRANFIFLTYFSYTQFLEL